MVVAMAADPVATCIKGQPDVATQPADTCAAQSAAVPVFWTIRVLQAVLQPENGMTDDGSRLRHQRRGGTILVAAGIVLLAVLVGIVAFGDAPVIVLLAGLVPVFMVGYGVRARRAATAGEVLVSVETREAYIRAGNGAYAILFGTILLDSTFGVLPREHLHDSLFYIGILPPPRTAGVL